MILRKRGQVIMPATFYPYQGNFSWIQFLQLLTLAHRYQPVFGTMNNIGMAIDSFDPFIGT